MKRNQTGVQREWVADKIMFSSLGGGLRVWVYVCSVMCVYECVCACVRVCV